MKHDRNNKAPSLAQSYDLCAILRAQKVKCVYPRTQPKVDLIRREASERERHDDEGDLNDGEPKCARAINARACSPPRWRHQRGHATGATLETAHRGTTSGPRAGRAVVNLGGEGEGNIGMVCGDVMWRARCYLDSPPRPLTQRPQTGSSMYKRPTSDASSVYDEASPAL